MAKLTYEQALAYLNAMKDGNGSETSLVDINGKTAKATTFYVAGLASDLPKRNGQLLLPSDKKETGITNFENGNILPEGKYVMIFALRGLFDNTTANVTPHIGKWKDNAEVAFANGEKHIMQSGAGTLFETSGTDVSNSKASTGNDDDFRDIVPVLLRPKTRFELQVLLNGTATGAYKYEYRAVVFNDADKN